MQLVQQLCAHLQAPLVSQQQYHFAEQKEAGFLQKFFNKMRIAVHTSFQI